MKYTIKKLAELAGISTRTLRYYDQIGLLIPSEVNESNYRIYDEKNVNKLQRIMFYRTLGFPLEKIKQLVDDPNISRLKALEEQQELLQAKRNELDDLLTNIERTIKSFRGEIEMTADEKFQVFKKMKLEENEDQFGQEIRKDYGEKTISDANKKFSNLTEEEYQEMTNLEKQLIQDLVKLKNNPDQNLAKKVFEEHKQWLIYTWTNYNGEMHRGLVDMYLQDERFAKYYNDKAKTDVIELLRDVVYQFSK